MSKVSVLRYVAIAALLVTGGYAFGEAYGTFECMGVVADLPGGYTVGDISEVRVFIDDAGVWKRQQDAVRVGFEDYYASSVFGLEPDTSYDFKVEFYDNVPALVDTQYLTGVTRAETGIPTPLAEVYVSTAGSDGGAG
ncbi:MAG: hypothetical protein J7M19_00640, partial [Planctomycetes bacterium]|nr:hypothetical protein [Planctomycetota bacterium]